MTLWIQPLFGDPYELPFSPPDPAAPERWRSVYHALYQVVPGVKEEGKALHQLRLIHKDSMDLSEVKEGDVLHLVVTERMVERWISEYCLSSTDGTYHFWYSTMSWFDGRWGDPYETPSISYRTPLVLRIVLRIEQDTGVRTYQTVPDFVRESHGNGPAVAAEKQETWYSSLRDTLRAFQEERRNGEEMTDTTREHLQHLWMLYHGTNQHQVDAGRWYE